MHSNPKLLGNWSEQRSSAKNVKSAPQGSLPSRLGAPAEAHGACWEEKRPLLGSAQGCKPTAPPHQDTPEATRASWLGVGGGWDTGDPIPSLTAHPGLARRRKIRLGKKKKKKKRGILQLTALGREAELRNRPARAPWHQITNLESMMQLLN